jgi:hypothetical protein
MLAGVKVHNVHSTRSKTDDQLLPGPRLLVRTRTLGSLRLLDSHAHMPSPIAARRVARTFCSLVILPVLPAVRLE